MSNDPQELVNSFRIDVSPTAADARAQAKRPRTIEHEMISLLRHLVAGQERQNELMEDLIENLGSAQRQRAQELGQWREANPVLARRCRIAAEALSQVQTEFLENLTIEVKDNQESLLEGDFMLNEFVDRYGPRLAHLNSVLQVLSQLSSSPAPSNAG
jgi:hypothetical protein